MMRWLALLALMTVIVEVRAGVFGDGMEELKQRTGRIQVPLGWSLTLPLEIGNPPQRLNLVMSPQFSELIAIDKSCGVRRKNCPRYCNDELITHIFCPARCQVFTQQGAALYCRGTAASPRYDGKSSKTSEYLGIRWSQRLQGTRKIYGNVWKDDLRLIFADDETGRYGEILKLRERKIVSADMFDLRKSSYDSSGTGFFGLSPTAGSIAYQLFSPPNIRRQILSFARTLRETGHLRLDGFDQMTMTIGDLDKARCVDWEWFPSASNDSWAIEADATEYLGDTYPGKTLVVFDFSHYMHQMPRETFESARSRGRYHQTVHFYCTRQLYWNPITFIVGKKRLPLRSRSITSFRFGFKGKPSECYVWMELGDEPKYLWEQRKWALAPIFFFEHCLAFDYTAKRIAVGRLRSTGADLNDFPDGQKGPWQNGGSEEEGSDDAN